VRWARPQNADENGGEEARSREPQPWKGGRMLMMNEWNKCVHFAHFQLLF
jgi:hypothetical protein